MNAINEWRSLGWRHPLWDYVRLYCSLRGNKDINEFLKNVADGEGIKIQENVSLPISEEIQELLPKYLTLRENLLSTFPQLLRTEEKSQLYCRESAIEYGHTKTKNASHHQSSKSLIASVNAIADKVCSELGQTVDNNPQSRCVWFNNNNLHVTARNLDGAIPCLKNPYLIWEIKEYWGKTSGGSKMSDAVYECHLVGRELREYEEISGLSITHVVFIDGKEQWGSRKSDLKRLIDLLHQGFIDHLIIGREVETEWERILRAKTVKP